MGDFILATTNSVTKTISHYYRAKMPTTIQIVFISPTLFFILVWFIESAVCVSSLCSFRSMIALAISCVFQGGFLIVVGVLLAFCRVRIINWFQGGIFGLHFLYFLAVCIVLLGEVTFFVKSYYCARPPSWNRNLKSMLHIAVTDLESFNVTYVVHWGTLLSQRREQTFLPWDADIDIYIYDGNQNALKMKKLTDHWLASKKLSLIDPHKLVIDNSGQSLTLSNFGQWSVPGAEFVINRVKGARLDFWTWGSMRKSLRCPEDWHWGTPPNETVWRNKLEVPRYPCTFEHLQTYCPNNKDTVLEILYGENFLVPDMKLGLEKIEGHTHGYIPVKIFMPICTAWMEWFGL